MTLTPTPDPWAAAFAHLDTGPTPHDRSRLDAALQAAQRQLEPEAEELRSFIAFAVARSRGQFRRARHLELIEAAVQRALATGKNLIISASVRHGKSWTVSQWLPAWYIGRNPDKRVILAGHEADFASRWGRAARDILTEHGPTVFGVQVSPRSEAANRWDIANHLGGMLTVGVGGSPIGRGSDLMIVDDPIKTYEAAMSPLVRQRVQEWWTGTMVSRIEPGGVAILVMARWHEDDLAGFLLREEPDGWDELRLPAIADSRDDPMGRAIGEALWPEQWSVAELEKRKRSTSLILGEAVWNAQYQQRPRAQSGDVFKTDKWRFVNYAPADVRWCRGWDLAASEGDGDYTVGAKIGVDSRGRWYIADIRRGQWSSDDVRDNLESAARTDGTGVAIELPQDPGQAGKDQALQLTRMLAGYDVRSIPQTGDKETRAAGLAAQQQAGNVAIVAPELPEGVSPSAAPGWVGVLVAECEGFPKGVHDDQVDALASGFNRLARVARNGTGQARRQRRGR